MKKARPVILPSLLISAMFFITGFFCYKSIFSFFEPHVPGITFEIISIDRPLKTSFLFSLVLGLMPLAIASLWLLLSLSNSRKIISLVIIFSCVSFAVFLRREAVLHYFKSIVTTLLTKNKTTNFLYPIDPRHFVYNIIIGFFIGCFISCLFFLPGVSRRRAAPGGLQK